MSDPWAFGWTQVLTIIGFAITLLIAFSGFRTFERWRREKLEEQRIEVAIEALALAYEASNVFAYIREPCRTRLITPICLPESMKKKIVAICVVHTTLSANA